MHLPFNFSSSEPLPPPIQDLLTNPAAVHRSYPPRGFARWRVSRRSLPLLTQSRDSPSASFYRLYQFLAIGWTIQLRNELEYFCTSHPDWAVADLPDPNPVHPDTNVDDSTTDTTTETGANTADAMPNTADSARYALLAGLTYLMCEAFNRRIELGLPRDAPSIVLDWAELRRRPKVFERVPEWAERVPPLEEPLRIPDEEGRFVEVDDKDVCTPLKKWNIIMPYPHIHFV